MLTDFTDALCTREVGLYTLDVSFTTSAASGAHLTISSMTVAKC